MHSWLTFKFVNGHFFAKPLAYLHLKLKFLTVYESSLSVLCNYLLTGVINLSLLYYVLCHILLILILMLVKFYFGWHGLSALHLINYQLILNFTICWTIFCYLRSQHKTWDLFVTYTSCRSNTRIYILVGYNIDTHEMLLTIVDFCLLHSEDQKAVLFKL